MKIPEPLNFQTLFSNNAYVNIVGNAQSIFEKKNGHLIDQYPTIRFNRTEIINPESQGTRWDILASSENNTFFKYNKIKPPFHTLIFTPAEEKQISKYRQIKFNVNLYTIPLSISTKLFSLLDAKPSTGMQILGCLESFGLYNVNIFGFDWKATPTFYETRNKGSHNFIKEQELVLGLIKKNGWNLY